MKFARTSRRAVIALAFTATLATPGCSSESPSPQPDPGPRYEQEPRDLCERSDTSGVAARFGLRLDERRDQTGTYMEQIAYWQARCTFSGTPEDGRFATTSNPFKPASTMDLRVYEEVSDLERGFKSQADLFRERAEREGPHLTATSPEGWWDESVALTSRRDPAPHVAEHPEALTAFDIRYVVRHDNLIILCNIYASPRASEADEAMAFLDELLNALMEENVSHLVRSD
jgi:hypothetical protein